MIRKFTVGSVVQDFDDNGNLIFQEFIAGDQVDYEDEDGEAVDEPSAKSYHPMNMIQSCFSQNRTAGP